MSINKFFADNRDVEELKKELLGLNEVYQDIANEIGVENAIVIYNLFHGTQVSFPNRLFSKEYIHKAIVDEYNGNNVTQLAQKYNYSERSVWRILKKQKQEEEKI